MVCGPDGPSDLQVRTVGRRLGTNRKRDCPRLVTHGRSMAMAHTPDHKLALLTYLRLFIIHCLSARSFRDTTCLSGTTFSSIFSGPSDSYKHRALGSVRRFVAPKHSMVAIHHVALADFHQRSDVQQRGPWSTLAPPAISPH